jgi:hypothetical protein
MLILPIVGNEEYGFMERSTPNFNQIRPAVLELNLADSRQKTQPVGCPLPKLERKERLITWEILTVRKQHYQIIVWPTCGNVWKKLLNSLVSDKLILAKLLNYKAKQPKRQLTTFILTAAITWNLIQFRISRAGNSGTTLTLRHEFRRLLGSVTMFRNAGWGDICRCQQRSWY